MSKLKKICIFSNTVCYGTVLEAATFEILWSHPSLHLLHRCVNLNVFELDALLEFVLKTVFSDKPLCHTEASFQKKQTKLMYHVCLQEKGPRRL